MRMRLLLMCVILCIMTGAGFAGDDNDNDNGLTVYGKVRVFAQADRARVVFDITGYGKSLGQAFDRAGAKMDSITARLIALGLSERDLATSMFKSGENYGKRAFLSSKKDFNTFITATIITEQVNLLKDIIVVLSESEVASISNISFELKDYEQLRRDALVKATAKAREKATLAAEQLGIALDGVLRFEEIKPASLMNTYEIRGGRMSPFNIAYEVDMSQGDVFTNIFPEEIQFDSEVMIVFAIDDDDDDEGAGHDDDASESGH